MQYLTFPAISSVKNWCLYMSPTHAVLKFLIPKTMKLKVKSAPYIPTQSCHNEMFPTEHLNAQEIYINLF